MDEEPRPPSCGTEDHGRCFVGALRRSPCSIVLPITMGTWDTTGVVIAVVWCCHRGRSSRFSRSGGPRGSAPPGRARRSSMPRRFDWYGLTLPGHPRCSGLACLGISLLAATARASRSRAGSWSVVVVLIAPDVDLPVRRAAQRASRAGCGRAGRRPLPRIAWSATTGGCAARTTWSRSPTAPVCAWSRALRQAVFWSARWNEIGEPTRGVVRAGRTEYRDDRVRPGRRRHLRARGHQSERTGRASFAYADDVQDGSRDEPPPPARLRR